MFVRTAHEFHFDRFTAVYLPESIFYFIPIITAYYIFIWRLLFRLSWGISDQLFLSIFTKPRMHYMKNIIDFNDSDRKGALYKGGQDNFNKEFQLKQIHKETWPHPHPVCWFDFLLGAWQSPHMTRTRLGLLVTSDPESWSARGSRSSPTVTTF